MPPFHAVCDCVLAGALLAGPGDPPDHLICENVRLQQAVVRQAVRWEILDPHCAGWFFESDKTLLQLRQLRDRYRDLCDAPPLADRLRLPDPSIANENILFNRAYRRHLEARLHGDAARAFDVFQALVETDVLCDVWCAIRDAGVESDPVRARRALKRLRAHMGEAAYSRGEFPPHVPLWRFQRID